LITHGRTRAARFLGYEIVVLHADRKHNHRGPQHQRGDRAESAGPPPEKISTRSAAVSSMHRFNQRIGCILTDNEAYSGGPVEL
jgi:hypothetical protein